MKRQLISAAVLALGASLGVAAPALAVTQAPLVTGIAVVDGVLVSHDAKRAYDGLSASDKTVFDRNMMPASSEVSFSAQPLDGVARNSAAAGVVPEGTASTTATGCWYGRANGKVRSTVGNVLYTYYVENRWCASGGRVTSVKYSGGGGETATPGWAYLGVTAKGAGVRANQGRAFNANRFVLGSYGIKVLDNTKCLRVNGLGTGGVSQQYTCGLV